MQSSAKLRVWIHKQVFSDGGDAAPVKLALFHITAGKYGGRVGTYPVPPQYEDNEGETDAAIDALTDTVAREAEHDSQSVSEGGSQSYAVVALDQEGNHVSRFPFRAKPVFDTEGTATDTPDVKGLIGQLMRHNECRERTSNNMLGTVMSYMSRVIESLTEENSRMQDERLQVMSITQNLLSEQQERDIRSAEHEAKQENLKELMGNVKLLLPAIASKLTGEPVAIEDSNGKKLNAREVAISRLLASLDDEQKMQMQSILTPQQMMALAQIIPGGTDDN